VILCGLGLLGIQPGFWRCSNSVTVIVCPPLNPDTVTVPSSPVMTWRLFPSQVREKFQPASEGSPSSGFPFPFRSWNLWMVKEAGQDVGVLEGVLVLIDSPVWVGVGESVAVGLGVQVAVGVLVGVFFGVAVGV
jgi:hypothetical protein